MPSYSRQRKCWAILIETAGILDPPRVYLEGTVNNPTRTHLFETRKEARQYRTKQKWTYTGGYTAVDQGNRIYKSMKVVRVKVLVEIDG